VLELTACCRNVSVQRSVQLSHVERLERCDVAGIEERSVVMIDVSIVVVGIIQHVVVVVEIRDSHISGWSGRRRRRKRDVKEGRPLRRCPTCDTLLEGSREMTTRRGVRLVCGHVEADSTGTRP
jgi:hypothetical protein